MAKKAPLAEVNERFGGKEKLVDNLMGLLDRGDESKDELRSRLLAAANSKLLRLHDVHTEIKESFGGKEKLVDAILELKKRTTDSDYREKLLGFTATRLMDLYHSSKKPSKRPKKKHRKSKKSKKARAA
jgi:hypothetical protein